MFTGLVRDIGTVVAIENNGPGRRVAIETGLDLQKTPVGASMACSGCCLTVTKKEKNTFFTDVSAETLKLTIISDWRVGTRVNIEPSLHLGDEIGGHFVFGHVDGLARIEEVNPEGQSYRMKVAVPQALARFIAPKGSVTLDGVSLTVNEVLGDNFGVNIIPHTWACTTLGFKKPGDALNVEIDMLARYVARMLSKEAA